MRIARLEELIRNIGVVELVRQIELAQRARSPGCAGSIEVLANENQQMQKRQRDFYLDLDSRLKRLEGGGAAASARFLAAGNARRCGHERGHAPRPRRRKLRRARTRPGR